MPTLDWLNRSEALTLSDKVPYRVLDPVSEHHSPRPLAGEGPGERVASDDNLLIQGDNLDALKALLPFYRGRVKCIFIDPPYNTKSAFEHYDDNLEHSQWLSMMQPRLVLLRELLAEDGSIWVTIDDNEGHYLKVLMDEVFGRRNFLTSFVWKKSYGGGAKAKWFVGLHEYALCYAKNLDQLPDMWLPPDADAVKKYYKFTDSKLQQRGPYRLQPLATTSMDERPNLRYPISCDEREIWPEKQWQWSRERVMLALENDELVIAERNGKFSVSYKQYLRDVDGEERRRKPPTIIEGHYTQHGTSESVQLFGQEGKFAFPKPEGIIQQILECSTSPGDLVLDSFLGSGTTAAVAHKMGRRWIGIEMGEHAETHCLPRLQKVIEGEQGGISRAVNWQGGGGFRFLRLGEPMFNADGSIHAAVRFDTLAGFVWMQETGAPLALSPIPSDGTASHSTRRQSRQVAGYPASGRGGSVVEGEGNRTPLLGIHENRAIYLLFNGILGDKRPASGNVLTNEVLAAIDRICPHDGPKIIYGEACRLGAARLAAAGVTFKHIPYDVKAR